MRSLLSATALTAICLIMTGCSITMDGSCDSSLPDGNATVCQTRSVGLLESIFGKACDSAACDAACDTACDAACDTACDAACDTACDAACDTACDAACDTACDAGCNNAPFGGIFGRHQNGSGRIFGKLIGKPNACDAACDSGCTDACDTACDSDCNNNNCDSETSCDTPVNCDADGNNACDSTIGKCCDGLFGPRRSRPSNNACDTDCGNGQCDSAACDDCPTGQSCDALIGKGRDGLFATRRCKPVTMNFCSSGCDTACDSNGCDSNGCDSNGCDSACDSNGKCGLFGNRCGKGGTGCFAGFLSGQGRGSCCGNSCSNGECQGSARASYAMAGSAMAGCACGSPKCNGSCGRGFGIADCYGAGCGLQHCRSCLSRLHGRHGFGLHGGGSHPYGGEIPHTANPAGMYGMQGGNPAPTYAYPYYTTRGPRDFLSDGCGSPPIAPHNPRPPLCLPSIGW